MVSLCVCALLSTGFVQTEISVTLLATGNWFTFSENCYRIHTLNNVENILTPLMAAQKKDVEHRSLFYERMRR